jgi:hypothetical protein
MDSGVVLEDDPEYLSYLMSLNLSALKAEPAALNSSSAQLTNALTTLCHTSYPTFLSVHQSKFALSTSLTSLSDSLTLLLSALPSLESSARVFVAETKDIQQERRKAALVLEHHDKLADLLAIPQLIDSCVRNGYFQEAMDLSVHAANLAKRFPDVPIVADVKAEVDQSIRIMLGQLLNILREQAKLPALFKAVNFLRKMKLLEEDELALAFLTSRLSYLNSVLDGLEIEKRGGGQNKEVCAKYLRKYVDAWREGVYDIVTQYTTIFLERPPVASSTVGPDVLHTLLTTFTTQLLNQLLALLAATLPQIPDPTLLNSLLTQLTYCATSFIRIGLDFRSCLGPLFADAVRAGIIQDFEASKDKFLASLVTKGNRFNKRGVVDLLVLANPIGSQVSHVSGDMEFDATAPPHVPPHILTTCPPIAQYTNDLLTALNGLRLLAPKDIYGELVKALDTSLEDAGTRFLAVLKADRDNQAEVEKLKRRSGTMFVKIFLPFIRRALVEGVYGTDEGVGKREDWETELEVVQEWEVWLQRD